MTYWAINAFFLAASLIVAVVASVLVARGRRTGLAWRSLVIALVVILAMTAVFDNVMIGVGLVAYDPSRISGVFIGVAPLEDFAYAVAGVILLPALWIILGRRTPGERMPQRTSAAERAASATPVASAAGTSHTAAASARDAGSPTAVPPTRTSDEADR